MNLKVVIAVLLIFATLVALPASAGTKYTSGSPDLSVTIAGTNEFLPGDTTTLNVIISNTGETGTKIIDPTVIERDDIPSTALLTKIDILENDAPVTIKTDEQMLGSIPSSSSKNAAFSMTVSKSAAPGYYNLIANLKYRYLYNAEQFGTDTVKYYYKDVELPLNLQIKIKEDMQLEVLDVTTDSMNVGVEGYITMTVKNIGYETGENTVLKISQAPGSAIVPTDASVYIGEFAHNDEQTVTFKASVSGEGDAKTYPVLVFATYKDSDGLEKTTDSETVGVDVGGKVQFTITSESNSLRPGQKSTITIVYKNDGDTTAYNAQARISAVKPFTSNDDTAYLGDIKPGETAIGVYEVSVSTDATVKSYGIDTEVRYRDALDNSQISDSMKAQVEVGNISGASILTSPIVIIVIVFVILIGGYLIYTRRLKK